MYEPIQLCAMMPAPDFAPMPDFGLRSPHWSAVRAAHLRLHPTCAACGGTEDVQVHHIWPYSWPGGEATELVETNFITLCEHPGHCCHVRIGHLGDWRSRNPDVVKDSEEWLKKTHNRPYPPGHSMVQTGELDGAENTAQL